MENSPADLMRTRRTNTIAVAPILIVIIHIGLCAWGAYHHSPTIDEPAYLASGVSHWEFGRFDLCQVSPPLVRMVAAIPVRLARPSVDWRRYQIVPGGRAEHTVGDDFLIANGPRSFWLFTLGRWGCLPFSILGACVAYRWAHELFGKQSAYFALLLWCFCPNILAHAQLMTPDVGVTALCLTSAYSFWKWSTLQTWRSALVAGGALGLAVLAKTNAVALFPALTAAFALHAGLTPRLRTRTSIMQIGAVLASAVYVVNLGYGFEGSFRPLGKYQFFSRSFAGDQPPNRFRNTLAAGIPVPLPSAFLEGIDLQRRDFENPQGTFMTYFRGSWHDRGWWWYYIYVVAVKVPTGTWILLLLGSGQIAFGRSSRRIDVLCYLAAPGLALFALTSSQTGFGHSLRYVLPAFPFAFVIASAAVDRDAGRYWRYAAVAALTWMITSSVASYPHCMSYFNEWSGGVEQGHFHLLDGNVDWGQDVLYVRDWLNQHPEARPAYVDCWGRLPLAKMGIDFRTSEIRIGKPIPSGWYIVSVNHLRSEYRMGRKELASFLHRQPVGRVTYAINIYHVP